MKNELIDKLLNGQATAEEEHLIAQLLQEEDGVAQWQTEDETSTYDRIIGQRRIKYRLIRWAAAATLAFALVAGAFALWPQSEKAVKKDIVATKKATAKPDSTSNNITIDIKPIAQHQSRKAKKTKPAASTADSLQIYIERLEQELAQVTDSSTYIVKAEQVIRADERLQKLVQRIMIGEAEKNSQPIEAMNYIDENKEEQP